MFSPAKQRAERMARRLPTTPHCAAARGADGARTVPTRFCFSCRSSGLIIAAVEACARNDLPSHKNPTELREPNRVGILLIEYVRASDLQVATGIREFGIGSPRVCRRLVLFAARADAHGKGETQSSGLLELVKTRAPNKCLT